MMQRRATIDAFRTASFIPGCMIFNEVIDKNQHTFKKGMYEKLKIDIQKILDI